MEGICDKSEESWDNYNEHLMKFYAPLTDLQIAVIKRQDDLVRTLIESGKCDINAKTEKCGFTALHLAIERNSFSTTELLVNNGADIFITSTDGDNAIHMAFYCDNEDITQFFVKTILPKLTLDNFLLQGNDNFNDSILDFAFTFCEINVVKWIINKFKGYVASHPLHVAVRNLNAEAVKYLLDEGWDVNSFNEGGKQPLECLDAYSYFKSESKILTMLLEGGARFPWDSANNSYNETFFFDFIEKVWNPVVREIYNVRLLKLLAITPKFEIHDSDSEDYIIRLQQSLYFCFPKLEQIHNIMGTRESLIYIIDCWKQFILADVFVDKYMLTLPYFRDFKEYIKTIPTSKFKNETMHELTMMKMIQLGPNLAAFDLLTKPVWKSSRYFRNNEIISIVAEKLCGSEESELSKLTYFRSLKMCFDAAVSRAKLRADALKLLTESNLGQCLLEPIWETILDHLPDDDIRSLLSALKNIN